MTNKKKLSNPFSTGGGGIHFEAHVQASFVALMLTGGRAPCLPSWPITEIKLQGKIDGYDTDDLVVVVENQNNKERRKLLGQVKHSISISQGNRIFGEVMQAAWNDFNNPTIFTKSKDIIALITGPISATDAHNVQWLLNQARHTKNVDEFFRNVQQAKFSPSKSSEKLEVLRYHLKAANDSKDVSNDELYDFLNHFHLLGYDLGNEFGVVLSLLHSHISQFQQQYPQWVWARIVDIVQTWNQNAGTITSGKLPGDLLEAFMPKALAEIPEEFKVVQGKPKTDWAQHPDAIYLALATLIGAWQEKSECDLGVIIKLFDISYDEWLRKAREILLSSDSPLSLRNGIWKVVNRVDLWSLLGSHLLDQDLDMFRTIAVSVLKESDPAFELPPQERYAASIHGKVLKYSNELRNGIAEGLAILASQPDSCANCSHGNSEVTCTSVIREILTEADWALWGSLNGLLPTLAETAPEEFLNAVEKAMRLDPCPFDVLFSQEGNGITGGNYLTGLLWALEGLAWDEQYLVRACVALAELASHDPGGQWANRPSNSLVTILLPWLPQTLASVDKRKVTVMTLLKEQPDIAWNLIIQLLPGQHQTSSGSHKPTWRKTIQENWEKEISHQEYWQQVSFYAEIAVSAAGQDVTRLTTLVDHFDNLPKPAFEQLLQILISQPVLDIPEEERVTIWNHITKLIVKHRKYSDAKWALPNDIIIRLEQVAEQLSPTNPLNLYQHLFTGRDSDLYEEKGDWKEQRNKLNTKREIAISEIFKQESVEGVIQFAENVSSPFQVGYALAVIEDTVIEQTLLPHLLSSINNSHKHLVSGYIGWKHHLKGWDWCDGIDKSSWTNSQIAQFLAYLPFNKEAWDRASKWLRTHEGEYWICTNAEAYQVSGDLTIAIDKLVEHARPRAAINCLHSMLDAEQPINSNQCVRALLAVPSSNEPSNTIDSYQLTELIKFLQTDPSVDQEDLLRIEWVYISLLHYQSDAAPQLLESRLANDPEFFCEMIWLAYRSKKEDLLQMKHTEESQRIATNAWRLLHEWKIPPGTQKDGTFREEYFKEWLTKVKKICGDSGHLEVALTTVGSVLIYTPPDPNGLWIHNVVATALNDRESDAMRDGFITSTYNSRGVHFIDPTGKPERELAEQFRRRAEDIENAGFQRIAVTLRHLADGYNREAESIINSHRTM